MKTYIIKLLTFSGPVIEYYNDNQNLDAFTSEMIQKYGQFTQLSCKEIAISNL